MTSSNRRVLTAQEIDEALKTLPAWRVVEGGLERRYRFRTFRGAFGWMSNAALAIEKADHHPDWSNSNRHVTVRLSTHDVGGITQKDVDLALAFEALAANVAGTV